MASKRGLEQAILWLHNKSMEDSLDGINAELCLNIIKDLQEQNNRKGATIHKLSQRLNLNNERPFDLYNKEKTMPYDDL